MRNSQLEKAANFYDQTFGVKGAVPLPIENIQHSDSAQAIAILPDNRLLVIAARHPSIKVIKLTKSGSPDLSFAPQGYVEAPLDSIGWFRVNGLSVTSENKYVISGFNLEGGISLIRQHLDGMPDTSFGPERNGQVAFPARDFVDADLYPGANFYEDELYKGGGNSTSYSGDGLAIAKAPGGKIICSVGVSLGEHKFVTIVIRLLQDGSLDKTFNHTGFLYVEFPGLTNNLNSRALIQPDGKILVSIRSEDDRAYIVRYNEDGTIDYNYGGQGTGYVSFAEGQYSVLASIVMTGDGGVVAFGEVYNNGWRAMIVALTPEGSYQSVFNRGLPVIFDYPENTRGTPRTLTVQEDGKLVVGTDLYLLTHDKSVNMIVRYLADGSIDTTFGGEGSITLDDFPGSAVYASMALTTNNQVTYLVKSMVSDSIVRLLAFTQS